MGINVPAPFSFSGEECVDSLLWSIMALRIEQCLKCIPPEKWDELRPHVEALYRACIEEIKKTKET